jgi:hypothetical protein
VAATGSGDHPRVAAGYGIPTELISIIHTRRGKHRDTGGLVLVADIAPGSTQGDREATERREIILPDARAMFECSDPGFGPLQV